MLILTPGHSLRIPSISLRLFPPRPPGLPSPWGVQQQFHSLPPVLQIQLALDSEFILKILVTAVHFLLSLQSDSTQSNHQLLKRVRRLT